MTATLDAPITISPRELLARAKRTDSDQLRESDAKALLDAIGIATPARQVVRHLLDAERLPEHFFPGDRVVVKAIVPGMIHKTEAGAVEIVSARRAHLLEAIRSMALRLDGHPIEGFLLEEFVPHEPALGHELLVGLRTTQDLGPVVTVGAGGLHAELLASALKDEEALAVLAPPLATNQAIERALLGVAAVRLAVLPQRGRAPVLPLQKLTDVVRRLLNLARTAMPDPLLELEINPLAVSGGRLVALDAVARCAPAWTPAPALPASRPIEKIQSLLEPASIALVGVSEQSMNPGRIILRNVLRSGFDPNRVVVVKSGAEAIDGVRCVPSLDQLPEEPAFHGPGRRADLVVLSVSAAVSSDLVETIARERRGESVILIPGGFEEHGGTDGIVGRMRIAIERSRATAWLGPVVNGGNCLGIRSVPGAYDTLFIPDEKLPRPERGVDPVALLMGSGAFAVSKWSKLASLNPVYTISIGNQTDLTAADYLEYLRDDRRVETVGVYLEGFRPLDGIRFLTLASEITGSGRAVIVYRGGRSAAGHAAATSHTAAIAGDYRLFASLAREAGVLVADTIEEFEDLTLLHAMLRGRSVDGLALGAVTNAGYESVAIADNAGPFRFAALEAPARADLTAALERSGLGAIATVRNPLDVTPVLGDLGYEEVVRAVLGDPGVNVGVVGCVPLTGALRTLGTGLDDPDGIVVRLGRIAAECTKAWVAIVDAGSLYDPMASALERRGIPVFRSADRALHAFGRYCTSRLERHGGMPHRGVPRLWS